MQDAADMTSTEIEALKTFTDTIVLTTNAVKELSFTELKNNV
jgi:hypothetical protein